MIFAFLVACGIPSDFVVQFNDSHNYDFEADIQAQSTDIVGHQDALLDWGFLTSDLLGHPLDPAKEIHKIAILHFPRLSEEQVLLGIDHETLKQSDLNAYVELYPEVGQTQAMLTEFSMQGVFVDPDEHLPADSGSYLLTFTSVEESTQTLAFFSPQLDGEEDIYIDSNSASLNATVDLLSMATAGVSLAERHVVDWSQLTESGTGRPLTLSTLDRFTMAGFAEPLSSLQDSFFNLAELASVEYNADVMGKTAVSLTDLVDVDGNQFSGFDSDLTWLVFLRCSFCVNPAPLFVGALEIEQG